MESIGYLTSIRIPERTSVNSWFICPQGKTWMATRYVAGGNNVPRISGKMFEGIRPFKRRMRAFYASAMPLGGHAADCRARAAVLRGSGWFRPEGQERAPTGAPRRLPHARQVSVERPLRDPDTLAGRGLRNPGQAVPRRELLSAATATRNTRRISTSRRFESVDSLDRRTAIGGTRSCRSSGRGRCRRRTSRSRPSTSGRRLRPGSRASSIASTGHAARSGPRHRPAAEPHRIQQHDPGSARRRPASRRRFPAGRCRLRVRQHRRRAVAVAGADGEVRHRRPNASRGRRSSARRRSSRR